MLILTIIFIRVQGLELSTLESRITNGKLHYEVYSTSGSCWENAVNSMIPTCNEMDETSQSQFAAKLTSCHLKRLGLKELSCPIGKGCELDQNSYIAYTHFFTHSFDICVYVSYSAWQKKTQKTIKELASAADLSLQALESSQIIVKKIFDVQEDVNYKVSRSIELHKELHEEMEKNKQEMQGFALEFMSSSKKFYEEMNKQQEFVQKWMGKIYDSVAQIGYLQEVMLGELWDVNSLLFYAGFAGVFWFFTSFPETYSARPRVFSLCTLEVLVERQFPYSRSTRSLLIFTSTLLIYLSIRKYRRYDKLSYDLLRDFLLKIGNKAIIAFTPHTEKPKPLPSPLKEQCLNRLKKIRELPQELEFDYSRRRRISSTPDLSKLFEALSEKKSSNNLKLV